MGIEPTLEIADEVREDLLPETVVEAIQAAERGDEFCLICGQQIASVTEAALLVFEDRARYKIALSHRACQTSQHFYTGNVQTASLVSGTFALAWRAILREAHPRAVFLWENKTNFDGMALDFVIDGDEYNDIEGGEIEDMRELKGFEVASAPVDVLEAPRISQVGAIHRRDGLELRDFVDHNPAYEWQSFPTVQPDAWRTQAVYDGKILLVYGTALQLDRYDPDHLTRRIEAGKVVAGVIPFAQDDGTVHPVGSLKRAD